MGEGGMLTTNNIRYDRQFRLLRQHGMSVSDRLRHEAKQIIFEEYITMGYNYRLTDIQAAIGIEQLKKIPALVKRRREIAARYQEELSGIDWLILPQEPAYCRTNWQSFQVRVKKGAPLGRDALMQYLLDKGVATRRGVMNSHQELPYRNYRWNLPNSVQAADSGLILPLFAALTDRQQEKVISLLRGLK
jgi:dTDP-4-amino-4,6-dideoxygalactose transaminase